MSCRLGIADAHLLDPLVDDPPGIVWPRARLRMELHGPRPLAAELQPFDRAVVKRHVALVARVARRHREAVVLRGNEDRVRPTHENGVVRAAMAEGELERLAARGEGEELVTEADTEDRDPPDQVAQCYLLRLEWCRVAGAVREEDAVEARKLVRVHVMRVDGHGSAGPGEAVQDRPLAAIVDDRDLRAADI